MATTINGSTGVSLIQDGVIALADLSATGTASSSTFLRGDNAWATPAGGGVTHLGTMTTTSGTSQTITGLDFTDLNMLIFIVAQCSHSDGTSRKLSIGVAGGANLAIGDAVAAGNCSIGQYIFDLR